MSSRPTITDLDVCEHSWREAGTDRSFVVTRKEAKVNRFRAYDLFTKPVAKTVYSNASLPYLFVS